MAEGGNAPMKKVRFNPGAKRDWDELPQAIQKRLGFGLGQAQQGRMPTIAKVLKGFGGASVLELKVDDGRNLPRRVHGGLRGRHLCPARLPEEVEEGDCNR
jgi:phage-related protein